MAERAKGSRVNLQPVRTVPWKRRFVQGIARALETLSTLPKFADPVPLVRRPRVPRRRRRHRHRRTPYTVQ
eukprot:7535368-Pyramimonas_sp.AAC.1